MAGINQDLQWVAKEAGIELVDTQFTGCLKDKNYLVTSGNLTEFQLARFAELLIRHCADQCNPESGIKYSPNAASSRMDCKQKILSLLG